MGLRNSGVPMWGTYDDHDYGMNDGDSSFAHKDASQRAFLDFLGHPADSPLRKQKGVYTSHSFDVSGHSILVVMLDMRFHKDPYGTKKGDFLGEEQWSWLEQLLDTSTAKVHLIVSSLQLLEGRFNVGESWGRFPEARTRMLDLLTSKNVSTPIVLSGDVHFAEMNAARCNGGSRRLLEVTSS